MAQNSEFAGAGMRQRLPAAERWAQREALVVRLDFAGWAVIVIVFPFWRGDTPVILTSV